jgi:phospholipid/cholesterol/gamma-HCH transport system permease protein
MKRLLNSLGSKVLEILVELGMIMMLAGETVKVAFTHRPRWRLFFSHLVNIGVRSQAIVGIAGGFTGMVFAVQTFYQFHKVRLDSATGAVVAVAMAMELGPVLAALMVAGRVGAAVTAELGTMKVTEQIDALRSLGVHPVDYLVVPRFLAMMISLPLLTAEAVWLGIMGGYVLAVHMMGAEPSYYMANMVLYTRARDIIHGLIKSFFFAFLLIFIACHKGMQTEAGSEGVGRSTNQAVVVSCIAVLISDFFLTLLLTKLLA